MPQLKNDFLFLCRIALAEKIHCKPQFGDRFLGMLEMMLCSIFIQAEAKMKNQDGEENFRLTASNEWDNDDGMDNDASTSR